VRFCLQSPAARVAGISGVPIRGFGGPGQHSYVIALYTYMEGFIYNRLGFASAITVSLTILVLSMSKIFVWLRDRGRE